MPGSDFVGFVLSEEDTECSVHAAPDGPDRRRGAVAEVRVGLHVGDPLGLCEQSLRLDHGVVAADEHAQGVRFLGAGVRGQRVLRTGNLEGVTSS